MEIEFNAGRITDAGVNQSTSSARRQAIPPAEDTTMSFERTQALEQALKEAPQVRPDAVVRASALVADADYPSEELLNQMAGLLAKNINRT